MLNRIWILSLAVATAACGGGAGGGANTADDVDGGEGSEEAAKPAPRTLKEGSRVCLNAVAGQRYPIEDALAEYNLEVVDNCISADVMVEESEEEGAFSLRYQMLGDAKWKSCELEGAGRVDFLASCVDTMITEIGAGAASSGGGEEGGDEEGEEGGEEAEE